MANNDFGTLQSDLADRVNVDSTVAANATRLKRYLNQAVQHIAGRWPWKWLEQRTAIQTVLDETAGTVSVTKDTTAVTGVGTAFVAADAKNSYIQFSGNNDWYSIASRASTTSITLDQAFGQTTLSGATYTLRRIFYSLPNTVDRVIDVRGFQSPRKLTQIGETTIDLYDPNMSNVGTPIAYGLCKPDPTLAVTAQPQWQIVFEPIANVVANFEVRTLIVPTDMSGSTDICIVPYKHIGVVLDLAEYYYAKHQNDPDAVSLLQQAEIGIQRMIENSSEDDDTTYVLQPNELPSTNGFIPMPSAYEPPTS